MKLIAFELVMTFPKFHITIPFSDLDNIYIFIFSLQGMNTKAIYLIKDIFHNRILDVMWQNDLDSDTRGVISC